MLTSVAHSGPCGCAGKLPSDQVARECGLRSELVGRREGKDARNLIGDTVIVKSKTTTLSMRPIQY
ncbi:hypothetical protein FVEG_16271 [Fusarium verticillioides 7600]|uniref:Uncharacterized protein n=1 Tax=Gibberella moniliformis (strain M3125 / FGSC 7600) TaxID=334819 RepID=W7MLP1_GIBM7|nr:hypothetical protein FVEG_16271 [Fusarium verticillioides 7600]EWG48430.1 hypothetical protein FVEG_16271 [Fusarium verticillioides 7600]